MGDSTGAAAPPLLVVAGMPRAATTTLFHNFGRHPGLFAPARKEPNYFSVNHGRGIDWYLGQFAGLDPGQRAVDASALYFVDPEAIGRLADYPGDVRLLLSIRDPGEFALSWHRHAGDRFDDVPDLEAFLDGYRWQAGEGSVTSSLPPGSIADTVDRFAAAFGDRLLLFTFEHFGSDAVDVLQAVERFAGLEPYFTAETASSAVTNASGRALPGPVKALFRNERLVSVANRVVPRPLLVKARRALDRVGTPAPPSAAEDDRALAVARFAEDRVRLHALFANGPIRLGGGASLPPA